MFSSYKLPPASAGGEIFSGPALAEIKIDASINKALAKASRNQIFFSAKANSHVADLPAEAGGKS